MGANALFLEKNDLIFKRLIFYWKLNLFGLLLCYNSKASMLKLKNKEEFTNEFYKIYDRRYS